MSFQPTCLALHNAMAPRHLRVGADRELIVEMTELLTTTKHHALIFWMLGTDHDELRLLHAALDERSDSKSPKSEPRGDDSPNGKPPKGSDPTGDDPTGDDPTGDDPKDEPAGPRVQRLLGHESLAQRDFSAAAIHYATANQQEPADPLTLRLEELARALAVEDKVEMP